MITFLLIIIVVELGLLLKSFNEVSEEASEDLAIIKKTYLLILNITKVAH